MPTPSVSQRVPLARGATFSGRAVYRDSVTLARLSLVGYTIKLHVRSSTDELLGVAVITAVDLAEGEWEFAIAASITARWPLELLYANVSYEVGGVVVRTSTFGVLVEWSPTR